MADVFTVAKRSEVMSKIRSKNTKIEMLVRKWLYFYGFRYRIHDKRYPGTPDIVISKYKTAIFVHGCFWHGHENCKYFRIPKSRVEYWTNKLNHNIERDKENIRALEQLGWNVIVIWECQLKHDPHIRLIELLSEIIGYEY
jgi:DNA mismatch endonuclease, patch repair protein